MGRRNSTPSWHSDMAEEPGVPVLFVSSMKDKNAFLCSQHTTTSQKFCWLLRSLLLTPSLPPEIRKPPSTNIQGEGGGMVFSYLVISDI